MKPITKTIIFIIAAAAIVLIITLVAGNGSSSPATSTDTPIPTTSTSPTTSPVVTTPDKTYTLADVAKHAVKSDCWTTINGNVYNLTSFIPNHPGGDAILVVCGKDGTAAFTDQHGGQRRPASELAQAKIGVLIK